MSWWCLLALHVHWDLWKIIVLLQWEFKNACWTPSKNVTFFGWFYVSAQRQRFFSITSTCITWSVFTEYKQTCATKHEMCSPKLNRSAQRNVKIREVYSPKWTRSAQRNVKCVHGSATEVCNVTWCVFTEVQQKCATQHDACSPKYNTRVQRNMKRVHRIKTYVCNVTLSVFTEKTIRTQRKMKCFHHFSPN